MDYYVLDENNILNLVQQYFTLKENILGTTVIYNGEDHYGLPKRKLIFKVKNSEDCFQLEYTRIAEICLFMNQHMKFESADVYTNDDNELECVCYKNLIRLVKKNNAKNNSNIYNDSSIKYNFDCGM